MGWIILLSGIAVNITGVIGIKFAQHHSYQGLGLLAYIGYFASFFVISLSFRYLDMGAAYAFWSGVGSLLILTISVLFFDESLSAIKLVFFTLIMVGVIGISLTS